VVVRPGGEVDPAELVERLVRAGYRREYQVEHRGEVAARGSIVDVYPSTADAPLRIDLWGDEVERLTTFGVADQRSVADVDEVTIFPARELLPTAEVRARAERLIATEPWGREQWERLAAGELFDGMESWLPWLVDGDHLVTDLIGDAAQLLLIEPRRLKDRAADLAAEEADLEAVLAQTWGASAGERGSLPSLHLDVDTLLTRTEAPAWSIDTAPEGPGVAAVEARGWDPTFGDPEKLVRRISDLVGDGYRVVVAADGDGSARRIAAAFADHGLHVPVVDDPNGLTTPGARIVVQQLERGVVLPAAKLAVLGESDVTGRHRAHRRARPRPRDAGRFFDDLKPGDYVVHEHHGVARYEGMTVRAIGGVERDYLLLAYRGGDRLYVPTDQIHTVRHYTGGETPTLNRMGGADFSRAKAKVRSAVQEIAQELIVLYQKRMTTEGVPFSADSPWQHELEDGFPYQETPDQLAAIEAVKADMEASEPMDRLVCGDVGFGKTEVAIRAAFKAVQDGYQAAVLVPTTLLAQQHFQTFSERYAGFPLRVEALSRFLTPGQAKQVTNGLADGTVDVVIGTHRLLSDDVKFKKLGLLVVDEEQRFGVTHKERIKQMRTGVDVLTLTATPIPRTLEMSLTGIRDLTLLNTPPAERQPILTYVGEYDDRAVAEAIRRELLREGQVFFVHNRVQDIDEVVEHVRELAPEARVAVAHGQMDEGTLERVVIDFWDGEYDVLVCTTIIESGIDMPTVNTLVVDRADLLGLGQLHQLRGRVGRAGQRAYAYLLYPPDYRLTEEAYERLKTIGEQTELGSGFKIAMRDLEIRGAGNLLGRVQTGHIAAVGYDLYCKMVTEAVAELKGEHPAEPLDVTIDIPLDAHLPASYVAREDLRIEAYRRLAAVTTEAEVADIETEWQDRYGLIPELAAALLTVARLRAECHRLGIGEIVAAGGKVRIKPIDLKMSQEVRLRRLVKDAVYKEDQSLLVLPLRHPEGLVDGLITLLRELVPDPASVASSVS
jgi:transcription-repair coupling factor (superfamily II helicase)